MKELIAEAIKAKAFSYSPYSHYQVGAALLTNSGRVYTGCNIENAAYGPTNCAERTAFFKAISEGERDFKRIAIVGGHEKEPFTMTAPCGVCRQVMIEFCDEDTFEIVLGVNPDSYQVYKLKELLPLGFGPKNLETTI